MREFIAWRVAPPAPLAEGEVVLSATASASGGFGMFATTEPALARGFVFGPNGNRHPFYEPPRSCPAMLYRYEAPDWRRVELEFLPVSYPHIALLPRGELLVTAPRQLWTPDGRQTPNAHVFGPDGAHRRAFTLGDNIEDIVVDDAGTIWTTHGERGWPEAFGLVRWNLDGTRCWNSGIACSDNAVNPNGGVTWAHRFRATLIRVQDGITDEYDSPVHDVHAIAFDEDRLLLTGSVLPGGPGEELSWCALVDGAIQRVDSARIIDAQREPVEDWEILASHGSRLYFADHGDGYHRVDIAAATL